MTAAVVLAKSPQPGRSKTRLCPPCTPEQAADLAEAALRDTLDVVCRTRATRRVLVLDGPPLDGVDPSFEVVPQRDGGLGDRLAGAFADVGEPMVLVGMDTPQLRPGVLDDALQQVRAGATVLGAATDGGWWALGSPACPPEAFAGVPMSTSATWLHQVAQLRACGIDPVALPELRDVDHWPDALAAAEEAPHGRFARSVAAVDDLVGHGTGRAGR